MNCCPLPVIRACKCVSPPLRRLNHLPSPLPPSCRSRCRDSTSPGCDPSPHFVYGGYVSRPWERLCVRHPFQEVSSLLSLLIASVLSRQLDITSVNSTHQDGKRPVRSVPWEYLSLLPQNTQDILESEAGLDSSGQDIFNSQEQQSLSSWNYFPVLPHDIHEPLGLEEGSGKSERDVHSPEFRPLCKISRHKVELRDLYGGDEYEYRPPYYYESICQGPNHRHPSTTNPQLITNPNVGCVYPGFSCIQRSQTVYLTRRRLDSTCWESFTRSVPSSCDCMWPILALGEVAHQYSY